MPINRVHYSDQIKKEIVALGKIEILVNRNSLYSFLNPLIGNSLALMVDLMIYLDGSHPQYSSFEDQFYNNRQASMHRNFFSELHIAIEAGLLKIAKKQGWEVESSKRKKAHQIFSKILKKCTSLDISNEMQSLNDLIPSHPSFNDYLHLVLNNTPNLSKSYKIRVQNYFDILSIIRNKVSHSNMNLSDREYEKIKNSKLSKVLSNRKTLQMTFEGYKYLIYDVIKFFDEVYKKLSSVG